MKSVAWASLLALAGLATSNPIPPPSIWGETDNEAVQIYDSASAQSQGAPITCPNGEVPLNPWWVNRFVAGAHRGWELASGYQCGSDILLAQVEQAWATMPIAPNTYEVQPSGGYAVAELGVNLIVDTTPRTMDVTL